MKTINQIYINGAFVKPHGTEKFELINPSNNLVIGTVILGDEEDTQNAIAAAKGAFKSFSSTTKQERIRYIQQMSDALIKRQDDLTAIMVEEYGATLQFARMCTLGIIGACADAIQTLEMFDFERIVGRSKVQLQPLGVVGIITPWNASNLFIIGKLTMAISAGCTAVIKPSEMSALQTQVLLECLHDVGLPAGVFNIVNGRGDVVGAEITRHQDISKISFTGSTAVGKAIAKGAVDTMKRVTLELGGKSPNIIFEDADLSTAIPMALAAAFMNSGQACIAGTRLLIPETKLAEVNKLVKEAVAEHVKVDQPNKETTTIGPLVSKKQYDRVQNYITAGINEGAELLVGGEGHPEGLESGNFVKPTVFTHVSSDMKIAREEIFGPVLTIITFKDEEEAIKIANDTVYGLQAYVNSGDFERAKRVASRIDAGRVLVNSLTHDSLAPFGGFKQSGIGREYGVYGLEAHLEPRTILV
jgi:aldehyde dehydrogenase (NAD+)